MIFIPVKIRKLMANTCYLKEEFFPVYEISSNQKVFLGNTVILKEKHPEKNIPALETTCMRLKNNGDFKNASI